MSAIQVIVVGLLSTGAVLFGFVALMNLASCLPQGLWPPTSVLMLLSAIAIGVPLFYLAVVEGSHLALSVASVEGFACVLIAYFLGQRFEAPFLRSNLMLRKPSFFPTSALVYFSFSASFLVLALGWLWGALPIVMWAVIGIVCVELALWRERRRLVRHGREGSRTKAIAMLNMYQGRGVSISIFESGPRGNEYPFP